MKSNSIFNMTHPNGSTRNYRTRSGSTGSHTCLGDVGYLSGSASAMMALVLEGYSSTEPWQIINLVDNQNVFLGSVAVLGATSGEHAVNMALRTFNGDFDGVGTANHYDTVIAPAFALVRFLDHVGRAQYKARVSQEEINRLRDRITGKPVDWNGDSLCSHDSVSGLVADMVRNDDSQEMQTKVIPHDFLSEFTQGSETDQYDSIVSQVSRLDGLSKRILAAMGQAADKVQPINVTKTDPFKKHGVVNVAQVFELSDGQSVTIVYHNPDSTPSRLDPKDLVTSWKFMLNKRDVTAVLQPKSGKDVNIPELAKRMMKIVEANSARFVRNQERKLKAENALDELAKIEQEKRDQIAQLDEEISNLQHQLDELIGESVEDQNNGTISGKNQDIPKGLLTDENGDILNSNGKPFLMRSVSQRFITKNNLTGYVPKKVENGYVLHKLDDAYFQQSGFMTAGNPQYSPVVAKVIPRLIFEKFNRTFIVAEGDYGKDRFEVVDLKTRQGIGTQGDNGENTYFFKSAMDAYDQISAELNNFDDEQFNKTALAQTPDVDMTTSILIAEGNMEQPHVLAEKQQKAAIQDKQQKQLSELDALRDENGKLNPISDNPMERVAALNEMTLTEKVDAQASLLEFFNRNGNKTMEPDAFDAEVKKRQLEVIKQVAGNSASPDYLKANQMYYTALKDKLAVLANNPEDTLYKVTADSLDKVKKILQENGIAIEEPPQQQEPELTRYNIKPSNPKRRKPDGTIRLTKRQDGLYDVMLQEGTVGGEYVGDVEGIKKWLAGRMQSLGDALDGVTDWEKIAGKLELSSGNDVLGVQQFEPAKPAAVPETPKQGGMGERTTAKIFRDSVDPLIAEPKLGNISLGGKSYKSKIDAVIDLSLKIAEMNNGYNAIEVADELQYVLNQNSMLTQYHLVMPKLDRVTKGNLGNKIRRLNQAFKNANTVVKLVKSTDKIVLSNGGDKQFNNVPIYTGSAADANPYYVMQADRMEGQAYGKALDAILAYLNDDAAISGKEFFFGQNGDVIDTATHQLGTALKAKFQEIQDKADQSYAEYTQVKQQASASIPEPAPAPTNQADTAPSLAEIRKNGLAAISAVKPFLSSMQYKTIEGMIKSGEESEYFANRMIELKTQIDTMPSTYQTDGQGKKALAQLHYFRGNMDWYITEKDKQGGTQQAFGYADIGNGMEAGYISIDEITGINAELDLHFEPQTIAKIQGIDETEQDNQDMSNEEMANNVDAQWLDQIIEGSIDLASLSMDEFAQVAEKYAGNMDSPMYAKLEQALSAITVAKMEKAKAVQ